MKTFRLLENKAIEVYQTDWGQVSSGEELHRALGIKSKFNDWIKRMVRGHTEFKDYWIIQREGKKLDYLLSTNLAAHIVMIQRGDIGGYARQLLIDHSKEEL